VCFTFWSVMFYLGFDPFFFPNVLLFDVFSPFFIYLDEKF
jgi:hypothetical protein